MRLFSVGDFHSNEELKQGAVEELAAGDYDLAIFTGDYETPEFYQDLIGSINTPFLSLTGNWDFDFSPPDNGEYEHLYNYQKVEFEDLKVVLLGSVYPDSYRDEITEFFQGTDRSKRVVASHYPPHMLGDLADNGNRAGFKEFRELIMREKPALWLCGHIHEDYGKFSLMDTTVLNTAAAESGKGWRIDLGDAGVESADEVELR